jgi:hypothetical protein
MIIYAQDNGRPFAKVFQIHYCIGRSRVRSNKAKNIRVLEPRALCGFSHWAVLAIYIKGLKKLIRFGAPAGPADR